MPPGGHVISLQNAPELTPALGCCTFAGSQTSQNDLPGILARTSNCAAGKLFDRLLARSLTWHDNAGAYRYKMRAGVLLSAPR